MAGLLMSKTQKGWIIINTYKNKSDYLNSPDSQNSNDLPGMVKMVETTGSGKVIVFQIPLDIDSYFGI
jgi:hypothetical protein